MPRTAKLRPLLSMVTFALSATSALSAPDLIVINADVYTVDSSLARADAFAVEDGKFSAVGLTAEITTLADADTKVIDAAGRTVTPGFIDGHAHLTGSSPIVTGVDISYIKDKSEWLRLIKEADAALPEGKWILGGGWDHTLSDAVYPTKEMLDEIVPDRPVFLTHIDGHYAWANSKALELAGITATTEVPPGGEIVLNDKGEPSGILLEGAAFLVSPVIPVQSDEERFAGLATMQAYANSFGLTGVHEMGGLDEYLYIVEKGNPTLRAWYGQWGPFDALPESIIASIASIKAEVADTDDRVAATGKEATMGPLLKLGYVKLINDGVLSAHTAVLLQDYADKQGWKGEWITSPEDLALQVAEITKAGFPVAVHSIGDSAVKATLDAFEAAKGNPVPFPNRIEHIELVQPEDIARFKALNVTASMQPNHATNSLAYLNARVGEEREARAYVWKSMLENGINLAYGADYPTSPLNPLVQMADSIFRVSPFGFLDGAPFHPEQALGFEQALHAYTMGGASITPWADQVGSITVGKWADFVVLDAKVPEPMDESFRKITVANTYFAGQEVYAKP